MENNNETKPIDTKLEARRQKQRGAAHVYANGRYIMLKHDPFNKNNDVYFKRTW